jgi:hypothetical protein
MVWRIKRHDEIGQETAIIKMRSGIDERCAMHSLTGGKTSAIVAILAFLLFFPVGVSHAVDGTANWLGMPQVDIGFFFVGADYRREDFGDGTKSHTYPVRGSSLVYPWAQLVWLRSFSAAGAATIPPLMGPAASPTRNIGSEGCRRRLTVLHHGPFLCRQHLSPHLAGTSGV